MPLEFKNKKKVLVLTSSVLDERKVLYTDFIKTDSKYELCVWSTSYNNKRYKQSYEGTNIKTECFPEYRPLKFLPYQFIKIVNDFIFDYQVKTPTRLSMRKHFNTAFFDKTTSKIVIPVSKFLAFFNLNIPFDKFTSWLIQKYSCSPQAKARFRINKPDVILCTGPNRSHETYIIMEAKNQNIKTIAAIHSWDNITTKARMNARYDAYLVWSEQMKKELIEIYPYSARRPIYIVGAPQYDVFFDKRFLQSRADFCQSMNLDSQKPIILYAVGSPNLIQEHYAVSEFTKALLKGEFGDAQLIIRPHPHFDGGELTELFSNLPSHIVFQKNKDELKPFQEKFQDSEDIKEWVNTFRHSNVVINSSSSVCIDAAIFNTPVVNLDFDPNPSKLQEEMVFDINHLWAHFKPIAESGGVWLVKNYEELFEAVKTYLKNPELHSEKRKWIAEYVCGKGLLDGKSGQRWKEAIEDFLNKNK